MTHMEELLEAAAALRRWKRELRSPLADPSTKAGQGQYQHDMKTRTEATYAAWKPGVRITEMHGAEVIERPLHAVLIGNGPPLVLLHGLAVSGEMYAPIVPALARSYRLLIPDLRGQGASASLPGPYTPEQLTTDLAGLLRHLGLRRAAVLGYSQGGPIALQLVHDRPDLVGRLILVCSYAFNMASRRERFEGRLVPWMFRILGPRLIGQVHHWNAA
jgi:pimeloyl-ACP methyl ester carboxylesterase